jgi:hypothetical protein
MLNTVHRYRGGECHLPCGLFFLILRCVLSVVRGCDGGVVYMWEHSVSSFCPSCFSTSNRTCSNQVCFFPKVKRPWGMHLAGSGREKQYYFSEAAPWLMLLSHQPLAAYTRVQPHIIICGPYCG